MTARYVVDGQPVELDEFTDAALGRGLAERVAAAFAVVTARRRRDRSA